MEQRLSMITLAVTDLAGARRFYERLGWQGQEVDETVFFQCGGMAFVLWGRDKLAEDCGRSGERDSGFGGICLAYNARSEDEVDEVIEAAEHAGATVTKPAGKTFYGGYAGIFADPDGHAWEIAYNPGLPIAEDGSITVPEFAS